MNTTHATTRLCRACGAEKPASPEFFQPFNGSFRGPCLACTRAAQLERFWAQVRKTDGCWEWIGYVNKRTGYGSVSSGGRRAMGTHVLSWTIAFGNIPDGMCVCHECDNRLCVRPDHLFLGTIGDNNRDMWAKGRGVVQSGSNAHTAKLSPAQVLEARAMREAGLTYTAIARHLAVDPKTARAACLGLTWAHVTSTAQAS